MKILITTFLLIVLMGCTKFDHYTSSAGPREMTKHMHHWCIDGVHYYRYDRGMAVAYHPDGTIKTCDLTPANHEQRDDDMGAIIDQDVLSGGCQ